MTNRLRDAALAEGEGAGQVVMTAQAAARASRVVAAARDLWPWARNWLPDDAMDQGARAACAELKSALNDMVQDVLMPCPPPAEDACDCPSDDHWDCQGTGLANGGHGSLPAEDRYCPSCGATVTHTHDASNRCGICAPRSTDTKDGTP